MQYTGFKDKHGKEIYEGDILKNNFVYFGPLVSKLHVVYWVDSNAAFATKQPLLNKEDTVSPKHWKYLEVVGNIFENPELLES